MVAPPKEVPIPVPEENTKPKKDDGSGNLFDLFDAPGEYLKKLDPSKMIEDTKKNLEEIKEKALNPDTFKPDIKMPTDMFKDLKKENDSTKSTEPPKEPKK